MTIRSHLEFLISLFALGLSPFTMANARELPKHISMIIHGFSKKYVLRGTILVAEGENALYSQSFGFADEEACILNTAKTQYLIGSITKQFTAAALLKALYDKRALLIKDEAILKAAIQKDLNKPVSQYLPRDCEIWEGTMPDWANQVTLHHLLTHSSGLANYTSLPDFQQFIRKPPSLPKLVTFFKNEKPNFNPGEKFSYCNSGYLLLGEIVQQISGEPFNTYLERIFFKPLRMTATFLPLQGTVIDFKKEKWGKNVARGYQVNLLDEKPIPYEVQEYWPMQLALGAGGIISTVSDCLKWNNALYAGTAIPKFLAELMLTPHIIVQDKPPYHYCGYGIGIGNVGKSELYYGHSGGIPGFFTTLLYVPSLNLSCIAFTNVFYDSTIEIEQIKTQLSPEKKEVLLSLSEDEKERLISQIMERWLSTRNIAKEIVNKIFLNEKEEKIKPEKIDEKLQTVLDELFPRSIS